MKELKDTVLTVLQCDRFHVVGVSESAEQGITVLSSPLAIRQRGDQVVFDRPLGAEVALKHGDWPVMVTRVHPGEAFHASVLKAHAAIEQMERLQASGIVIPGQEDGH